MKLVLDTETINLEKQFVYDLGYTIADADGNVVARKSYVISQVFNNKELFATGYYANKMPLYLERLASGYSKKVGWGHAMRYLANDIKKYGITEIYAYNSKFDTKAIAFMCAWFNTGYWATCSMSQPYGFYTSEWNADMTALAYCVDTNGKVGEIGRSLACATAENKGDIEELRALVEGLNSATRSSLALPCSIVVNEQRENFIEQTLRVTKM